MWGSPPPLKFLFFIFLLPVWVPRGAAILVRSLTMEYRTKLARDVFDALASHSALVYDVTDTYCWAQHGSTHGCVFATFKRTGPEKLMRVFLYINFFNVLVLEFLYIFLSVPFLSISPMMLLPFSSTLQEKRSISSFKSPLKTFLFSEYFS